MVNQTTIPVYAVMALLLTLGCGTPAEPETQGQKQTGAPVSFEPNGEIRISRDGETVGTLPAEYVPLEYPDMPWRGDPAIGMSDEGIIYVAPLRQDLLFPGRWTDLGEPDAGRRVPGSTDEGGWHQRPMAGELRFLRRAARWDSPLGLSRDRSSHQLSNPKHRRRRVVAALEPVGQT